jgi:hypothetical protein
VEETPQVFFFYRNLVVIAQMLQVASPAAGEIRAKGGDSFRGWFLNGSELRLEVILLLLRDLGRNPVPGGGERDKNDLSARPPHPFPSVNNLFDIHRQLFFQFFSAPFQGIA